MTAKTNLVGRRFARLVVIGSAESSSRGMARWVCACDCGKQAIVIGYNLVNGHSRSCGCLKAPFGGAHAGSPTYSIWSGIISRCMSPGTSRYKYYGGRGIRVCDRWLTFENFLADMGEQPPGMQIDRIDNAGHYEPTNCRWATRLDQARNKRNNHVLVVGGERITLAEAAERSGLKATTIRKRVVDLGWSAERALTTQPWASVS